LVTTGNTREQERWALAVEPHVESGSDGIVRGIRTGVREEKLKETKSHENLVERTNTMAKDRVAAEIGMEGKEEGTSENPCGR